MVETRHFMMEQATKGLAAELAKDKIRFNAVCPVAGETAM